jgi:diacylglycerol O-acyltransferase / wax synthase
VQRVSGSDAIFLSMEKPTWHQHTGGLIIYDVSEAPDFSFDSFAELVRERLSFVPKFRCRVKEVPLGLDRPLWVQDRNFDVANHMHRIAVPPPGGPHQLGDLVGDLMGHQLDRRMPLWEMWYIEGLEGGNVAILAKTHHSLMDGASGQGLAEHMFDLEPNPPAPPPPPPELPRDQIERMPNDLELVARSLLPNLATPFRLGAYAVQTAARGAAVLPFLRGDNPAATPMGAPPTPWNAGLSPRRRLSFISLPLDEIRTVRQHFDVKINDVILALCAGAMRGYLIEQGALPDRPLVCGVPISTRELDDKELGNKIANMFVALPTELDDPVERLRIINRNTMSAKEMTKAVRARHIQAIAETAPPALINLAFRTMFSAQLDSRVPMAANALVSNVPGPPIPLYTNGARVRGIYPFGPLMLGLGLNITVMSYIDSVDFGVQVDPVLVRDPWQISDRIPDALAELTKAAGIRQTKRAPRAKA